MTQRKWIIAAVLAACLSCGGMAGAAEPDGAALGLGMSQKGTAAMETDGVGAGTAAAVEPSGSAGTGFGPSPKGTAVTDAADVLAGSLSRMGGFLTDQDLGGGMSYHSLTPAWPDGEEHPAGPMPFGQIQIRRDGILMTADVVNLSIPQNEGAPVAEIFETQGNGEVFPKGRAQIALFNAMLANAGPVINGKILDIIAQVRREMKDPIPYSFAHVELRSIEPLHAMKGTRLVYTAGTRVLLYVDGWIVPVYLKSYLYEEGQSYRLITVIANDSVKDAARAAGEALITELTGAE